MMLRCSLDDLQHFHNEMSSACSDERESGKVLLRQFENEISSELS